MNRISIKPENYKPDPVIIRIGADPIFIEFLSQTADEIGLEYEINELKNEFTFTYTYELKNNPDAKYFLNNIDAFITTNHTYSPVITPNGNYAGIIEYESLYDIF